MRSKKWFEILGEKKFFGKYLNAFGTSIYLALVMSFDMAVFIMGVERVLEQFGGFFINIEGNILASFFFILKIKTNRNSEDCWSFDDVSSFNHFHL